MTFDAKAPETWPVVMGPQHIAAIWSLSRKRVNVLARDGRFVPAPFSQSPRRWRRSDVLRVVEPVRVSR